MLDFEYKGIRNNKYVEGQIEALNNEEAADKLKQQKIIITKLIKSKKCNKVIFAGNIIKPKISKLKLDLRGLFYIPRIVKASKKGDAAILKVLIKILSENKIT